MTRSTPPCTVALPTAAELALPVHADDQDLKATVRQHEDCGSARRCPAWPALVRLFASLGVQR